MSSLVVLYLFSYYRFILLPHYELVPPRASVAYVQIISSDVARASPQPVPPLVSHICQVLYLFFADMVSSLAYPNWLGIKRLGCCYCCIEFGENMK
jgi:hypothetical protein